MPGDSAASFVLRIETEAGPVLDTTLVSGGTAGVGRLEPGLYDYSVFDEDDAVVASGRFDVEARTDEMLPARFADLDPQSTANGGGVREPQGRPLRTMFWPYLLIIGLLCVEWVARRRAGLR